jgi:four helix bundle protein
MVDPFVETFARMRCFRLADQLLSAALSVSSNIAEGNGRVHRAEYAHHVSISRALLYEVESILCVSIRTGRLKKTDCESVFALIEVISRQLTNLLRALYRKPKDKG